MTEEPGAAPRGLDRLSRTLLRIITLHPDRDHDAPSVAALAQVPLHDTEDALDSLVDAGLLADADTPGRFRLPFRTIPTPPPRTLERCAGGCPAL